MVEACGLAVGGTITATSIGMPGDGNMRFDFDLIANNGTKMLGSWEGNVIGKIDGIEFIGIDEIRLEEEIVIGMEGHIVAPEGTEIYTISGTRTGKENLRPGIYIVRFKGGNSTKVIVK